jgi:uncharacterized protein (TIGR01777 family)
MNLLITGGTGFVGTRLINSLISREDLNITVLTRNKANADKKLPRGVNSAYWDPENGIYPAESFKEVDAIVNLMGENLASKRWSDSQKRILEESRVKNTEYFFDQVKKHNTRSLRVIVQASAIGIYPKNLERDITEETELDSDFLGTLCKNWENQLHLYKEVERKVTIRIGVILGKEGGALKKLLPIFKLGLGGKIGSGTQMMSWIHVQDVVNLIIKSLFDERYDGVINAVSPNPVTNAEFSKELGKALHRPAIFPVPEMVMKIVMGEMSTIVLDGQKVIPKHLEKLNHHFQFPELAGAFKDICG